MGRTATGGDPRSVPGQRFWVAGPGDAAALLALKANLDRETSFMLLEPGERARQLYERMGFAVEGRRECLLVDGHLVDELYMAKLLPPD